MLSLKLYSIQVPYTWYTIDVIYGNTCFWVSDASGGVINNIAISIPSGNYIPGTLVTALNDAFTAAEITALKTKANGGKRFIISYVSIGSAEKYRYYWNL